MIANPFVAGLVVLLTGYLLGSIPTAYLVTRKVKGEDIRKLGGGNVGGLNVFREVGFGPAVAVIVADLGKGAAAAAIARFWLDLPPNYVFLAGLAAVTGHNWMVWLKFTGGRGMGATLGALMLTMPSYGYWLGLAIFLAIVVVLLAVTRNVSLSLGTGLFFLPLIIWVGTGALIATVFAICLFLVTGLKSWRMFWDAWHKNRSLKDFIFDRWHRGRSRSEGRG